MTSSFKSPLLVVASFVILLIRASAQQMTDNCLELLAGHKIKSIIEVKSRGTSQSFGTNDKQPTLTGPARTDRYTWLFTLEKKEEGYMAKKELSRIEVSANGPVGDIRYDSDDSFESTDDAQDMVKSYLPFIKKSYSAIFTDADAPAPGADKNKKADSLYSLNIPLLDTAAFFSGLIFAPHKNLNIAEGGSWIDTLTTASRAVITRYTVKKSDAKNITIQFESSQTFLKKTASQASARNADGSAAALSLSISTMVLSKVHNGEITIDKATHLITHLIADITTDLIRSLNGQPSALQNQATLNIRNSAN